MRREEDSIARRSFLKGVLATAAAVRARGAFAAQGPNEGRAKTGSVGLREKFFGCIAGCHIGSAMGAVVEGWSWQRIEREHGTL
ncbi:MAG: hypothetical protein JSU70_03185, partial [Phycisphaerales bacterium]